MGATVRVDTTLHLDLAPPPGPPCDELAPAFPPGPLTLDAKGTTIYRENRFGLFCGTFAIKAGVIEVFKGRIELYDRVTLQQAPLVDAASPCNLKCQPENRVEGWLVGGGVGATEKMSLRALLGARSILPPFPAGGPSNLDKVVVAGVVVHA